MNKKIVTVFAVIFTTFLAFASSVMVVECFVYQNSRILFPTVMLSLTSLVTILFLVLDVFIGIKDYIFKNDVIIVGRKSKMLYSISKEDIVAPKIILNSLTEKSCFFSFYYNRKRHIVSVKDRNEGTFKRLVSDIQAEVIEDTMIDILMYILEIFCV